MISTVKKIDPSPSIVTGVGVREAVGRKLATWVRGSGGLDIPAMT